MQPDPKQVDREEWAQLFSVKLFDKKLKDYQELRKRALVGKIEALNKNTPSVDQALQIACLTQRIAELGYMASWIGTKRKSLIKGEN